MSMRVRVRTVGCVSGLLGECEDCLVCARTVVCVCELLGVVKGFFSMTKDCCRCVLTN